MSIQFCEAKKRITLDIVHSQISKINQLKLFAHMNLRRKATLYWIYAKRLYLKFVFCPILWQ